MPSVIIKKINSSDPYFDQVFSLREKILRQPLGLSLHNEDTSSDKEDMIFIALVNDKVLGCVMGKPQAKGILKLRQMAVDNDLQGKGIGRLLVLAAEDDARAGGFLSIQLHARQNALGFYEKLGYTAYGFEFTEVSIPHIAMQKTL